MWLDIELQHLFFLIAHWGLLQYHRLGLWCDHVYCCLFLFVHPVVPTSLSRVQRDSEEMRKRAPFISANFPLFVMDGFLIVPFGPLKNVLWSIRNCQFPYHKNLPFIYPAINCLDSRLSITESLFNPQINILLKQQEHKSRNKISYNKSDKCPILSHRCQVSMVLAIM